MKKNSHKKKLPDSLNKLVKDQDVSAYTEYYHLESTKAIRKLIAEELERRINDAIVSSEKKERYELPSWREYQADNIGYRRALREIIRILTKE